MTEINSKIIEGFVELEFLTETEKKKLEVVLNRNEKLKNKENARLRKLSTTETEINFLDSFQDYHQSTKSLNSCEEYKTNLSDLIQENFNKKNNSLDINIIGNCISCGRRFSILPWSCASPNSSSCNLCKLKMCKKCTHHMDRPNIEICKSCHKTILFEAKSGKWFYNDTKKDKNFQDGFRSSSVVGNGRWISSDKLCFKKGYGSADNLDNADSILPISILHKSFVPKRKYNNSAYFRIESPNRLHLSPETTENMISPFRRINKNHKSNNFNTKNYFDTTIKSEDSGCALDMDDETASESALKVASVYQLGSTPKCCFRPLQLMNQNNSHNTCEESQEFLPYSHIGTDLALNFSINGNSNQFKNAGEIMISLIYDDNTSTINITIHKCRNLVSAEPHMNCINPYIIIFTRPNRFKQLKQKTRTQFSTNNPVFEELFLIHFEIRSELTQFLILLLCHKSDKAGKDLAIGQVILTETDIVHCDQINRWFSFLKMNSTKLSSPDHRSIASRQSDLSQRYRNSSNNIPSSLSDCMSTSNNDFINLDFKETGEISLALKYVPCSTTNTNKNNNELHLWVKSAKLIDFESSSYDDERFVYSQTKTNDNSTNQNTKCTKRNISSGNTWFSDLLGYQDVLAKSHLFTNHGVHSREISATKYVENEGYYIWSSIMKFDSDLTELKNATLEISLWIHSNNVFLNKILPSRCIGSVFLGLKCDLQRSNYVEKQYHSISLNENRLWHAMLNKHNIWIDETLVLRSRKNRL